MSKQVSVSNVLEFMMNKALSGGLFKSLSEVRAVERDFAEITSEKFTERTLQNVERFCNSMVKAGIFESLTEAGLAIQTINTLTEHLKKNEEQPVNVVHHD